MEAVPASGPYYWESLDSDKDDLGQKAEEADMETSLTDKYFVVFNKPIILGTGNLEQSLLFLF